MDDERIVSFEHDLWIGGEDVYRRSIADDCLMVLPNAPFVMTGEEAIQAVAQTPRWSSVDFADFRVSRPQEGMIVIAYKATAERGGQKYEAYCTSTYRRLGHDDWRVVQHQQTVPLTRRD